MKVLLCIVALFVYVANATTRQPEQTDPTLKGLIAELESEGKLLKTEVSRINSKIDRYVRKVDKVAIAAGVKPSPTPYRWHWKNKYNWTPRPGAYLISYQKNSAGIWERIFIKLRAAKNDSIKRAPAWAQNQNGKVIEAKTAKVTPVVRKGLLGFWPLSEKFGTKDVTNHKADGKFVGEELKFADGPFGEKKGAVRFDGKTPAYIKFGPKAPTKSITIALYLGDVTHDGPLFDYSSCYSWKTHFWVADGFKLHTRLFTNMPGWNYDKAVYQIKPNERKGWHWVAYTYNWDTNTQKLWFDGDKKFEGKVKNMTRDIKGPFWVVQLSSWP